MTDEVVFCDGQYAIIKSIRPFSTGFNVYKNLGSDKYIKINDRMAWFKTLEAAENWLDKQQTKG